MGHHEEPPQDGEVVFERLGTCAERQRETYIEEGEEEGSQGSRQEGKE